MSTITTKDGAQIYYKDWGKGPPVTFSHGWPLNAAAWDCQMHFLFQHGFRVVALDRRGHGRSSQVSFGNDMNGYADARLDFTDLYAFPKPGDPGKSILIMDVHPSAGVNPPGPTTKEPFAPGALYEIKIDANGDLVADIAYQVRFASLKGGAQTATLRRSANRQPREDISMYCKHLH